METKKFNKLMKEKEPKKIIYMHCNQNITLTNKQLDEVIEKKRKIETKEKRIMNGTKI